MHHHNECSDDSNDNNTNPIENDTSSEHSESSLKITNKNDVDFIMPDQEQQDKRINEQVSENVEITKSSTPRSARSVTSSSPPSSSSFLTHKLMDLFKK